MLKFSVCNTIIYDDHSVTNVCGYKTVIKSGKGNWFSLKESLNVIKAEFCKKLHKTAWKILSFKKLRKAKIAAYFYFLMHFQGKSNILLFHSQVKVIYYYFKDSLVPSTFSNLGKTCNTGTKMRCRSKMKIGLMV